MTVTNLAWVLIAAPMFGAAVLLLAGKRSNAWGHWLGVLASAVSAVLAIGILVELLGLPAGDRASHLSLYSWIPAGDFSVDVGLLIDPLRSEERRVGKEGRAGEAQQRGTWNEATADRQGV